MILQIGTSWDRRNSQLTITPVLEFHALPLEVDNEYLRMRSLAHSGLPMSLANSIYTYGILACMGSEMVLFGLLAIQVSPVGALFAVIASFMSQLQLLVTLSG